MNDWPHPLGLHRVDDPFCVVASVANERAATSVREQLIRRYHLVPLARCQGDVDRSPSCVDDGVELGRKASSRAAQSIASDPPFPPEAS